MWPFGLKQAQREADAQYLLELEQYQLSLARWESLGKKYQTQTLRPIPPMKPTIVWKID